MERNGYAEAQLGMDIFNYAYHDINGEKSNRLSYVVDDASDYAGYDDIKTGQTSGNYRYNKIGELMGDASQSMRMTWRYGDHKLDQITRFSPDLSSPNIEFVYNPLGIRVAKITKPRENGDEQPEETWEITYYTYDANGQLMSTYTSNLYDEPTRLTTLKEQYIYGSKRVGVIKRELDVFDSDPVEPSSSDIVENEIGHKNYELTNHLNNVMMTISDRKVWNNTDGVYEPVIAMKADYYAFGMLMPDRFEGISEDGTRHLFNGMEHDEEVHSSEGNSYTTQFRQYDPRLGRWKSLDPLMKMFPDMSPYVGFDNNPIFYNDPLGLAAEKGDGPGDPPEKDKKTVKVTETKTETVVRSFTYGEFEETRVKGLTKNNEWIDITNRDYKIVSENNFSIGLHFGLYFGNTAGSKYTMTLITVDIGDYDKNLIGKPRGNYEATDRINRNDRQYDQWSRRAHRKNNRLSKKLFGKELADWSELHKEMGKQKNTNDRFRLKLNDELTPEELKQLFTHRDFVNPSQYKPVFRIDIFSPRSRLFKFFHPFFYDRKKREKAKEIRQFYREERSSLKENKK